jgi:hypothetical protein
VEHTYNDGGLRALLIASDRFGDCSREFLVALKNEADHLIQAMRTGRPTSRISAHTLGESLSSLGSFSFLENQLLIDFCCRRYDGVFSVREVYGS